MESLLAQSFLRTRVLCAALLLCAFLAGAARGSCGKGCAACDAGADACLVCDPFEKYQLTSEKSCAQISVSDCDVVDPSFGDPKCLQCKAGMLFDFTQQKCVEVPSSKKILNCSQYNQAGECVACDDKHFIDSGKCSQAAIEVEGCLVFIEANFCAVCEKNRRYDDDTGKCVGFSSQSNCASHSFASCDECLPGYNLELNSFFAGAQSPSVASVVFFNTDSAFEGNFRAKAVSNCVKIPFDGCLTYDIQDGKVVGCATCGASKYLNTATKLCDSNPAVKIKDCQYYTDSLTCYRCVANFYLDGNECKAVTAVPDCLTYMRDDDKCLTCIDNNYLDAGTNKCPARAAFPIAGCETHDSSADECQKCLTDQVRTTDKKLCLPKIAYCSIYEDSDKDTTELECKTCSPHYYLDSTKKLCLVQNLADCEIHVGNENNCGTCVTGYYKSDAEPFTCTLKAINGCEVFATGQTNECDKCKNLYSKSNDNKTCTQLTDSKCAQNTVNTTTCTHCVRGYFLNGGTCEQSNKTYDPLCTHVTDDGKCTHCQHGYIPFKLFSYITNLPANCAVADSDTGKCVQCAEDMDGADDNGDVACSSAADKTGKCKQLKSGIKVALADNDGECSTCRNKDEQFNLSFTCTDRTPFKRHNCGALEEYSDECKECKANTHPIKLSETKAMCLNPPTVFSIDTIENCLIYDFFANGKCLQCQNGHTLTVAAGNLDTCPAASGDAPDDWDLHYIDFKNSVVVKQGIAQGETAIAGCKKHYYNYKKSGLRCSECKDGFTAVTEYMDPSDSTLYYTPDPASILSSSTQHSIIECKEMTDANYVRYEAGSSLSIAADCKLAVEFSNLADNYMCLSCGEGKVGVVKQFGFNIAGSPITSTLLPISAIGYASCSAAAELSKAYKIFANANMDKDYVLSFGEVFHDTCSDNSMNVVHIRTNSNFKFGLGVEGAVAGERVNTLCQVIPATGKVDFCQVYTLLPSADATRDLALEDTYLCAACKPGYTLTSSTQGEQCLPIENCNQGGANTWMNACETCDVGFTWPIDTSKKVPDFARCHANKDSAEENCMFNSESDGECKVCKPDKNLNLDSKKCEAFPTFCSTNGFPNVDLAAYVSDDSAKDAFQSIFLALFLENYKTGPSVCASCTSATKMFMAKDGTDALNTLCVSNEVKESLLEGCTLYNGKFVDHCLACESMYIRQTSSNTCVLRSWSSFDRSCKVAVNSTECLHCAEGYVGDSSNKCVDNHHCATASTENAANNFCRECEWGYKRSSSDDGICELIESDDTDCLSWSYGQSSKVCHKCRDCSQLPVRKFNSNVEQNVRCVSNESAYDLTGLVFTYERSLSNFHEVTYSSSEYPIPQGKFESMAFSDNSAYPQYLCVRTPEDSNCSAFATNQFDCSQCKPGYYLDTSGSYKCKRGQIEGCQTYSGETVCSGCFSVPSEESGWKSYYKTTGNQCAEHTVTNCHTFEASSDACINCKNGYHKDGGKCKANVVATNCAVSQTNADICVTCIEKHYKDQNGCKPHTVANCSQYSSSSDACSDCIEGFYKLNSNCVPNTAPNCASKSRQKNWCASCSSASEYPNGVEGCVAQPTLTGCKVYKTSSAGCDECDEGFFLSQSMCLANPSGVEHCVVYSSATTCTTCASTHFLSGEVCAEVTNSVSNCAVYSADGVCSACDALHLLSATGDACTSVNENSCATWASVDSCATCAGNNVLKTNADNNAQCVASGIDHCLTPIAGTPNTCSACADGFLLKEGVCAAPKISISNCRVYDVATENCVECYPGNVLSADKTSCSSKIAEAGDFCARAHVKDAENPTCNLCDFGYSQDAEGKCQQCGGEGCFICDAADLTKCKVCKTSYFMSSSGTCSLNNPPEPEAAAALRTLALALLAALLCRPE